MKTSCRVQYSARHTAGAQCICPHGQAQCEKTGRVIEPATQDPGPRRPREGISPKDSLVGWGHGHGGSQADEKRPGVDPPPFSKFTLSEWMSGGGSVWPTLLAGDTEMTPLSKCVGRITRGQMWKWLGVALSECTEWDKCVTGLH